MTIGKLLETIDRELLENCHKLSGRTLWERTHGDLDEAARIHAQANGAREQLAIFRKHLAQWQKEGGR